MIEFSTRKDIEAPQDYVFRAACDFTAFERQALRRGIDVSRTSSPGPVGPETTWILNAVYRNRTWKVNGRIAQLDPPSGYELRGTTLGVDLGVTVDVMALARSVTRFTVTLSVAPKTLTARLLMHPLRLARRSIEARMETRIAVFAGDVEDKFRGIA